jgi:hypothetical protein
MSSTENPAWLTRAATSGLSSTEGFPGGPGCRIGAAETCIEIKISAVRLAMPNRRAGLRDLNPRKVKLVASPKDCLVFGSVRAIGSFRVY